MHFTGKGIHTTKREKCLMSLQEADLRQTAEQLGLTPDDWREITTRLGRTPTLVELSMFSVEWSEHCSYRRSKHHFAGFPRSGPAPVLVGEDAGGILFDDLAIVFKIESHNHPSQVEPKHGAATGVGGIIRDILSVGARPIALLNSLRFGDLNEAQSKRLFRGVVDGISWYGNAVGVPTIGGEVDFHPSYSGNCLVNVMCIGIATKEALLSSKAKPGCAVMILGARTGRDGIGGCSVLASQEMREALSKRPTVQVGDPYFGKCLIEATLESASKNLFVALKDMGAAGLTCTTSEMSSAGNCGMEIEISKIPARESGMEAWEFMMSESQERMLAIVKEENTEAVQKIFHKWGLEAEVIGKTISEDVVKIFEHGALVAEISTKHLTQPPPIFPQIEESKPQKQNLWLPKINHWNEILLQFLRHPSLVSKKWVFRQYDSMVQTNTVYGPGLDSAVLRVKGKPWGIAVVMEGNGRYCQVNPFLGTQYLAAEAARNLAVVGAKPLGITDGLNFGNPDKPAGYGEFVSCLKGLIESCRALNLPVVSGNVSFYNENEHGRILPTPILGMVGICQDLSNLVPLGFQNEGDCVYLLGPDNSDLSGSLFLEFLGKSSDGLPEFSWEMEKKVHEACRRLLHAKLLSSCHDVGQGGLFTTLAECMAEKNLGIKLVPSIQPFTLFSEAPSRILVSIPPANIKAMEKALKALSVPFQFLGIVEGKSFFLPCFFDLPVEEVASALHNTLGQMME
jgi:phosphoribosylformylglycinamidine synthase II